MDEHKETHPVESAAEETAPAKRRFFLTKTTYYALMAIFMAVIVLCGIYIGAYFWEAGEAEQEYADLEDLYLQGLTQPTTPVTTPTNPTNPGSSVAPPSFTDPTVPQGPVMLPSLKPIYAQNNDTVGYLRFHEDVGVAYPVMQSPYDEDFYLYHKFDKTPNGNIPIGCPYVPLACDVFKPSDNVIISGHYLNTGGMFAPLHKYQDQAFWEKHQTFTFDTLYEQHTYQIFAVFKTVERQFLNDGSRYGYPFHQQINFDSQEAFDKYIRDVKGYAFDYGGYQGWPCIETDIVPQYGDKLLCIYTCEYSTRDPYTNEYDGRLVIMAVRID